jgi:eukaryotic-like serine/threonine-protein kinase
MSRGDTAVKLRPQLVELLLCLAKRRGALVLKDEILAEVWPGQFIAESGLSRCVAELRQILQDDAQQPRFIETIPKRGYRIVAPVAWPEEQPTPDGSADRGEHSDPSVSEEGAPGAPVAPAVVTGGSRGRPRAWAGAVLAAVVLVVLAVAFVARRSPGAVLTERDTVLLADVDNATGDRVFDDALRLALAVNLEQAPFLRILPQEAVRAALTRSGRPVDARVVGPVALDVCRREGAAVLLAGSIAPLGSRYLVGLEAIACGSGESLGRAMAEAGSKERVLSALEQTASRIRTRLGESRSSLRQHDVPLVQATTPSLDALKALTLGDARRDRGHYEEALTHYRQATEIDPQFALAWARRGVTARNVERRDEAIPALRRAFELEGRVSQPERFFIEGLYYRFVEADPLKAIDTYRAWKRMYPGSPLPPNAIASTLSDELGEYGAAMAEARESIVLAPGISMPYSNLVQACVGAGRFADAKTAVADAASRGLDDGSMHAHLLIVALLEDDRAAIEREIGWAAGDPQLALLWLRLRAQSAVAGGRLTEAGRLWEAAIAKAGELGSATIAADVRFDRAEAAALVGDARTARALVGAALASDRRPALLARAAVVLALMGDTERARAALDEATREAGADPAPMRVWLPTAEALVLDRQGRTGDAARALQPIARFEKGADFSLIPLCVRALVAMSAGRPADAAQAFDDVVRLRAVVGANPWTTFARVGLARALRAAGDTERSAAAYDAFLASWKAADPGVPLLVAARRERAALAGR